MDKRKWTRQTKYTVMLNARVPVDLAERLRRYVEYTGATITDTVIHALEDYLRTHSPLDLQAEKGDEEK